MDDKLVAQLRLLHGYLDILREIQKVEKDKFLNDPIVRGAGERYLQVAIETCLNIGNRILSLEQFKQKINPPENYADIFLKLGQIGFLAEDEALELSKMAQFRNKLVHVYWELDHERVYSLIQERLSDIEAFLGKTSRYLQR